MTMLQIKIPVEHNEVILASLYINIDVQLQPLTPPSAYAQNVIDRIKSHLTGALYSVTKDTLDKLESKGD